MSLLGESAMCDLFHANRLGSGPGTASLAVVRTVGRSELLITERDSDQLDKWRHRAAAIKARPSLFDDPSNAKPDFEMVPWRFRYSYKCAKALSEHVQGKLVLDWRLKTVAVAAVREAIRASLDRGLPVDPYTPEIFDTKVGAIFDHLAKTAA